MTEPPRSEPPQQGRSPYPPAGTLIGLAVLLCVAYGIWKLEQVTELKRTTNVAVSPFSGTEVMRTPGGLLEVARIKAYERLTRDDNLTVFNGVLDLGTTVSEIDAAVLFRYHIEMAKEWPIVCDKGTCVVRAGPIQPTLPPAIYSDELRKRTQGGWARFNKQENLASLERSMTELLSKRAGSERNLAAAKAEGRKTVEEFARTWMLKHRLKAGEPAPKIVVLFPGEKPGAPGGEQL